ncbi:hypothetical protein [Wenxinia saemankumensis]|uniref:Uncharacterized protein n=1 Tax=Wenxinia saemankumensis TaxID=1447782 RepID=A0A1M6ENI0_9RHOB|nr:hypothetical protein [Wenxinia saemankumensis]SHI87065.1 hypothetical protein SAMN05444417_2092 [Wenxinia saemankumensis]
MARLVLFALFVLIAALAVMALLAATGRARTGARAADRTAATLPARQEDSMPGTIRTIAYAALLLLLTGVATGVIGGG